MRLAIDQKLDDRELDKSQKKAIQIKSKNVCVNAGAGSGKTYTILGKLLHILDQKLARPEEIIVMAYNNNVAEELRARFQKISNYFENLEQDIQKIAFSKKSNCKQCGKQFDNNIFYCENKKYTFERRIHTFHSYCFDQLKKNEPGKTIVEFEETQNKRLKTKLKTSFFENLISEIGEEDRSFFKKINRFFLSYLKDYKNIFKDIKNYEDYIKVIAPDFVSLKLIEKENEKIPLEVKSVEELEIANFLYLKGIEFIYEDNYLGKLPGEWSDKDKNYRPDFHLIKKNEKGEVIYDLYYEHFALDKNYNPPDYFDNRDKYVEDFKIKNKLFNGNLVQTFSYQKYDGTLFESLTQQLRSKGIHVPEENAISDQDALSSFKNAGYFTAFSKLLSDFLEKFKSSEITIQVLKDNFEANFIERLFEDIQIKRSRAFVEIFEIIFNAYQKKLSNENKLDFHDMIIQGKEYITTSDIKFLIVDEFQDISPLRSRVIQKIQQSNPEVQLFTVGDDWQSIYRFSGSDIKILVKDFENYFGKRETSDLSKTYRFNQRLCELTSSFILRNELGQLKKKIEGKLNQIIPLEIYTQPDYRFNYSLKRHVLEKLDHLFDTEPNIKKILFITRYNDSTFKNGYEDFERYLKNIFKNKKNLIQFSTIHSAKGDEADYVFLFHVHDHYLGFPSTIEDDPLLQMVTNYDEDYEHEEERRLFYVALTRTKNKIYLYGEESAYFIKELQEKDYPNKELKKDYHYLINDLPEKKPPKTDLVIYRVTGNKKIRRKDTPAKNAGLEIEDVIIKINNIDNPTKDDFYSILKESNGKSLTFQIKRNNQKSFEVELIPVNKNKDENLQKKWDIGIGVIDRENDEYTNNLIKKYFIKEGKEE